MASTAAISVGLNPLFAAISGENLKNKTKRGTLWGSEHRTTAKKFGKYRNINTAKKQSLNTAILQYRVETQCHTETTHINVEV